MATKTKKRAVLTTVTKPPKDTYIGGTPTGKPDLGKRLQDAIASIEAREGAFIKGDKGRVRKSKEGTGDRLRRLAGKSPCAKAGTTKSPKKRKPAKPEGTLQMCDVHIKAHTRRMKCRK